MRTRPQSSDQVAVGLLDPGRDPELEAARRDAPLGIGGPVAACVVVVLAGWAALAARRAGRLRLARALLALAGLGIGLGGAEVALRATADQWRLHVKVRDGCYHDNPRGYFQRSTFYDQQDISAWCTDRLSTTWAQCERATAQEHRDQTRVMAVGDSFTDGVGVFRRDTWPAALGAALGPGAFVVNCGRASSATSHVARRLLDFEARHDPDIVVYAFVLNDVPPPATHESHRGADIGFQLTDRPLYSERVAADPLWGPLSAELATARLIGERVATRRIARETVAMYQATYADPARAELVTALDLTATMRELASDRGAHFLVAVWPLLESLDDYPFAAAQRTVVEGLRERGVPVLDLLPIFEGRDEATLWAHPTDHHPNEVAHADAARAIAAELTRRGWFPKAPETPQLPLAP